MTLLFDKVEAQSPSIFSTPGTYTWTCPAGVTSIMVEAWGGGGEGLATASSIEVDSIDATSIRTVGYYDAVLSFKYQSSKGYYQIQNHQFTSHLKVHSTASRICVKLKKINFS